MATNKQQTVQKKMSKDDLGFLENFIISGTAAVLSKTAAAPLERVKLLVQNQDEMMKQGVIKEPYKGIADCTMKTFRNEGFWSFWRGNLANCIRYFPTQALNFAFKDKIKIMFHAKKTDPYMVTFGKNVAAGGVAGGLSLCFVYSLDYARTRLGNDVKASKGAGGHQYNGLIDVYRKTLKSDGIAGLYRGFVISCVGIVIYRGAYFGLYDTVKPIILGDNAGFMLCFLLGYGVTIVSETVSYPFDTVRRRMMMTSGQAVKYKGSMDCLRQIVQKEGSMSLFKGCAANILRGIAGAGVLAGFDSMVDIYMNLRYDAYSN